MDIGEKAERFAQIYYSEEQKDYCREVAFRAFVSGYNAAQSELPQIKKEMIEKICEILKRKFYHPLMSPIALEIKVDNFREVIEKELEV